MGVGLSGRHVLITGGSKGIGLAVAQGFAAEGCTLSLVSRNRANLDAAKTLITSAYDVAVNLYDFDLSNSENIANLLEACADIDILVNNAGAIMAGDVDAVNERQWREGWELKVLGYINMTRSVYANMRRQQSGISINIIGLAGEKLDVQYVAGSTGNAALMAFTKTLGSNSLNFGVRILGVNLGPVATERLIEILQTNVKAEFGDASKWQHYVKTLPHSRALETMEVADLVVFLGSARASYISGTVVTLDGGQSG